MVCKALELNRSWEKTQPLETQRKWQWRRFRAPNEPCKKSMWDKKAEGRIEQYFRKRCLWPLLIARNRTNVLNELKIGQANEISNIITNALLIYLFILLLLLKFCLFQAQDVVQKEGLILDKTFSSDLFLAQS